MAADMQGGYSREIFRNGTLEPKFTCNLCSKLLREPVQTFCGHRFCKSCINSNIRSEGQIKCTVCEQEGYEDHMILPDQIFPDKAIRKMMLISKFQVVCDSKDCPWKGTFKQYEEHFNVCDFKTQACPYCQQSVYRNLLQIHLERECRKYELTCDDCGRKVVRERMNHHQQFECQIEKIQCPVGCGEVKLRHYADHFREKKHENWVVKEISNLAAILEEVKGSERHLLTSVSESTASSFQMNEKIAVLEGQILQLRTQTNIGTGISQLSDSQGSSGDRGATNIDAKIRQQVEMNMQSINERLDALYREFERHRRQTESKFEQVQDCILSLERHLALKDMSMEAASYDGTFMWRVHDFTKKHQDAVQGRTISISRHHSILHVEGIKCVQGSTQMEMAWARDRIFPCFSW